MDRSAGALALAMPARAQSGDVVIYPFAGEHVQPTTQDLIENGYPVKMLYPVEGLVPTLDGAALVRNRPHPENGRLDLSITVLL